MDADGMWILLAFLSSLLAGGDAGLFNMLALDRWECLILPGMASGASWLCYFKVLAIG